VTPYRAAFAAALAVLTVYVITLAPSVTFWDAGEFIAAAHTLGIPHPPGTPLFVMIAHTWGLLFPIGEFAFRTNLLSAILSASGAGLFFLVVHESLRSWDHPLRLVAAAAAALTGAFTFTNWQNSNETEVYAVATFTIGAMCWGVNLWRRHRETERGPRFLLLVVFLAGISIGNHLLALLAGPAVVGYLIAVLWREPAADAARRREEWGQLAVLAGVWALLIGTGLGSTTLSALGLAAFLGASVFAATGGAGLFAAASLAIAAVGITPYLYLYIRSGQHPVINEAAPATFDALLAVIRRAQYPPRTPLDDPTVAHGADNPGRTLTLIGLQLLNYFQYFDWQWARAVVPSVRAVITVTFFSLGVTGFLVQRRQDRANWWLCLLLFLVTGLGLVAYMNFKPGFSLGFEHFPNAQDHEVRERDYFFVVSFIVWGLWTGIGGAELGRRLSVRSGASRGLLPAALAVALVPLTLNFGSASRRHGPDAHLAADFAYDLLQSAPAYSILFTYGDNDTFPLWWAQEVAGIRRDVSVVCLALANTDWYMRQLRDNPVRSLDAAKLPKIWADSISAPPAGPMHAMSDSMISAAMSGYYVTQRQTVRLGPLTRELTPGTFLFPSDLLQLSAIQQSVGRRPILWAATAGRSFAGLGEYVIQKGLGFHLGTARPDTTEPGLNLRRLAGAPLDVPATETLAFNVYRYADLLEQGAAGLDPTSASAAASLSLPFVQLVYAYQDDADTLKLERALSRGVKLAPDRELRAALSQMLHALPRDEGIPLSR
jgi:hypothetical protein